MVRQLVNTLQGTVILNSAPGQGTRIRVTVPIETQEHLVAVG
jgi:signal transduction histidine kinase